MWLLKAENGGEMRFVIVILVLNLQSLSVFAQYGYVHMDRCSDISNFLPVPFNTMNYTCRPVWNTFVLRFSQSKDNTMSFVLSAVYTSGWVGMAFSKDGMMVGASAMVGWINKEGRSRIKQYYLRGFTPSEVIHDKGELQLTNIPPAVILQGANIYLAFQLKFQDPPKSQPILLAFGTRTPVHHQLSVHDDKTTVLFNFSEGSPYGQRKFDQTSLVVMRRNHGILAITGWGLLLPAGAIVARFFRHRDPLWYYLHTCIQFVGFVIGLASVVVGKVLYDRMDIDLPLHRNIGIFVLVLSILQILAFFLRPDKDSKIRRYWNWYHHWFGRLALSLAALNILFGMETVGAGASWWISYAFILGIIFVSVVSLEVLLRLRRHEKSFRNAKKQLLKNDASMQPDKDGFLPKTKVETTILGS